MRDKRACNRPLYSLSCAGFAARRCLSPVGSAFISPLPTGYPEYREDGDNAAPEEHESDRALVTACRAGNRQAFTTLVRRHKNRLYTLAVRLLGEQGEAEDITQETFVRAYEKLQEFRGDALFSTWLHRICANLCLTRLAQNKHMPGAGPWTEHLSDPRPGVPDQMLAKERRQLIRWALAQLEPEFRAVIVLYHMEYFFYEEIADLLAVPVGTVRSRLHRGREKLKALLRPYLQDC